MKKQTIQQPPRMIQNVFVLLLLALFAGLSTFLVAMGAQVYRNTVARSDSNNDSRILSAVVRSAVWAEDGGDVSVEKFDDLGLTALTITNDYDGDIYHKRLYCKDGYLWESFLSDERGFDGDTGESLCEAKEFVPVIDGHMLTVRVTDARDHESEIAVYLRAGGADR